MSRLKQVYQYLTKNYKRYMYVCVCMNMGILVDIFMCVPTGTCMYYENVI